MNEQYKQKICNDLKRKRAWDKLTIKKGFTTKLFKIEKYQISSLLMVVIGQNTDTISIGHALACKMGHIYPTKNNTKLNCNADETIEQYEHHTLIRKQYNKKTSKTRMCNDEIDILQLKKLSFTIDVIVNENTHVNRLYCSFSYNGSACKQTISANTVF